MGWVIVEPLLRFSGLESCHFDIYSLGFRILDNKEEAWTNRFDLFKFGHGAQQSAAISGACAVLPDAARRIQLPQPISVVTAISSQDTTLNPNSGLAILGRATAASTGWSWSQDALAKKPHASRHNTPCSAQDRDALVQGAYTADRINAASVVVIDDFATRGATISDIGRAIRTTSGNVNIVGLVLGKNERAGWAGARVNNNHIPARYEELWEEGCK